MFCQAAERDWEEKRASLTQFSAQDINRLLEETQAELMKAIPDLDFAAKQITKPAVPPKPQLSSLPAPGSASSTPTLTPEHQPKTPPKPPSKDGIPRRGSGEFFLFFCIFEIIHFIIFNYANRQIHNEVVSDSLIHWWLDYLGELTVQRYRTEKPSKSPPPPPPRRSFPSGLGLTTNSSGEVITVNKSVKVITNIYLGFANKALGCFNPLLEMDKCSCCFKWTWKMSMFDPNAVWPELCVLFA